MRTFEGIVSQGQVRADWPGVSVEINTIVAERSARSEICVPQHTVLSVLQGGTSSVRVEAEGAPPWQGPKLVGAAGFFPAGRRMVSYWPQATALTYVILLSQPDQVETLFGDRPRSLTWHTRTDAADPFLTACLHRLGAAVRESETSEHSRLLAETLATAVQLHTAERFSDLRLPGTGVEDGIERVLQLILDEMPRAVPFARMVTVSGLPRGRFLLAFRARTGASPHQFILHERLARARLLLETTRRPVSEVADAVGYASASHLTQLFRQYLQTTPHAWRRMRGRI